MAEEATAVAVTDEDRELATKPVHGLFVKYSLITLIGMAAQAVMVILEGVIIGNGLGSFGLAVVGIIMPLELLNLALGGALGMGVATVAGNRLGAGDAAGARKAFSQGFWLSTYLILAISVLIFIFAPQIALMLGATPDLADGVVTFIRIFMCFYPFCILGQMMGSVLRVDEKPGLATAAQFGSAVLAVVWLYCSIFLANLGVVGAAVYYGTSIGLWFVVIFYFIFSKHTKFKIGFSDMKLDGALCREILVIGLPTFLMQAASLVYTTVINNYLGVLGGDLEISAFAILNGYLVYILNMMWLCATYGVQPLASVNFGAKRPDRLRTLIRVAVVDTAAAIAVVSALFIVCAVPICTIFCGNEPDLIALAAANALPLCALACLGAASNVMSAYFQAVDKVVIATVLGMSRYLVFTVPCIMIMSSFMGITGVWWAQPVADVLCFAFTMVFVVRELRRLGALHAENASDTSEPSQEGAVA
ncbi:multidrug transporter MatE [Gordonibacter sp. An230]|uniref:MATE family efflux transporter n=1 Tax=Gordonibacter sp. An230 TaxID=1965592 RepID=UPI000B38404E|nr:MATE family efflux transporter [Gordonibacter sp. An230]OUO86541.1 multidrug transporter MatE [Gordonibacter sp. An230]